MPSANGNTVSNGSVSIDFQNYGNVIDGKVKTTEKTRHGINPATRKPNLMVPVSTQEDVDVAVTAAKKAFIKWSATTVGERRDAMMRFANALKENEDSFASLLTMEQGKPLAHAKMEISDGFTWLSELAKIDIPEEVTEDSPTRKVITRYTPLGVVAAIVPWNFPVQLACGKIAPAVMAGNTIILKPSPFTPYCGLKLAELAQQFFPPGVIQALSGDDNLGPWLTAHPGVDKISFTGSTATGKKVMESASKTLKRVTLELGGNDPAIVCADVDIATVAPQIATLCFLNAGQICLALKRIYIHESIYAEFRDAMVEATKTFKVGEGNEPNVFLGPVQNEMQYERVKTFFADIEKDGLSVAVGGKVETSQGYYITPTIIDNPAEDSRLVVEEPFGPIVPIMPWSTVDEVVARANNTKMGLGASVWSSDLEQATSIAKRLEAGSVWINSHLEVSPKVSFGGHKESGIGAEWGINGLKSYCNSQVLFLKKAA